MGLSGQAWLPNRGTSCLSELPSFSHSCFFFFFPVRLLLIFLINSESSLRHFPFCSQFESCSEVFSINVLVSSAKFFHCNGSFDRDLRSCFI